MWYIIGVPDGKAELSCTFTILLAKESAHEIQKVAQIFNSKFNKDITFRAKMCLQLLNLFIT